MHLLKNRDGNVLTVATRQQSGGKPTYVAIGLCQPSKVAEAVKQIADGATAAGISGAATVTLDYGDDNPTVIVVTVGSGYSRESLDTLAAELLPKADKARALRAAQQRARKEEDVKAAAAAFMDGGLTVTEAADLWGANVADVQAEITRIRAARR